MTKLSSATKNQPQAVTPIVAATAVTIIVFLNRLIRLLEESREHYPVYLHANDKS
ncbi:hypothetical protein [Paenibacillus alvei]|uniref:Uncharacterized protein n=1 Tax=Paenibacillus alvei TaxID=44250 RepID=A0AAP6ZXD5_PAEAL|nr:hypothetical protein [Paenibacillus alvei]MCY9581474.1 hypothetical protein [Paenibacillus alvei]MCY9585519.1 hypothetical protein [Paenibacillus alvei]NEZ41826.1 hypothetical protein [Paenibacillus alvei]NOJ71688.1 hypothetical protein [Paenibacillus alvei]